EAMSLLQPQRTANVATRLNRKPAQRVDSPQGPAHYPKPKYRTPARASLSAPPLETTERRGDIGQRAAPHAREANSPRYYPDLTIEIGSAAGGAAALIGVVILIGNEGSVAMIPSRADIGMVRPA